MRISMHHFLKMYFIRHLTKRLTELIEDFRIVYLTGPRQAGKSTIARKIAAENGMGYYTLDDAALLASAQNDPQGLKKQRPSTLPIFLVACLKTSFSRNC
ncbi:AAA family ATPase [Desulfobulbus alkaliphilus]|uniref:AAA family ATPase n=1 Tax=Desulfobulbus alkaliphilus TaxID=869814 RepID=UPI001964EB20|nr:AAA family ATPase [Desulfobulbus alkaliphilus]MBM9538206.1 AAA family ATPase [Desulfobulbus alkaliphilus]